MQTVSSYRESGELELFSVDNTEADVMGYSGGFRIRPKNWAARPVEQGKIPSAEDSLINSDAPVVIVSPGDKIAFNFDYYQNDGASGKLQMRVIDSDGKILGTVTKKKNPADKPLTISLQKESQRYYIEVSDPDQAYKSKKITERYCYVMIEVVKGLSPAEMSRKQQEAFGKLNEFTAQYMAEHKITDSSRLRVADYKIIFDRTNRALGYDAFDAKYLQDPEEEETRATPAKKPAKTKRTKKSK